MNVREFNDLDFSVVVVDISNCVDAIPLRFDADVLTDTEVTRQMVIKLLKGFPSSIVAIYTGDGEDRKLWYGISYNLLSALLLKGVAPMALPHMGVAWVIVEGETHSHSHYLHYTSSSDPDAKLSQNPLAHTDGYGAFPLDSTNLREEIKQALEYDILIEEVYTPLLTFSLDQYYMEYGLEASTDALRLYLQTLADSKEEPMVTVDFSVIDFSPNGKVINRSIPPIKVPRDEATPEGLAGIVKQALKQLCGADDIYVYRFYLANDPTSMSPYLDADDFELAPTPNETTTLFVRLTIHRQTDEKLRCDRCVIVSSYQSPFGGVDNIARSEFDAVDKQYTNATILKKFTEIQAVQINALNCAHLPEQPKFTLHHHFQVFKKDGNMIEYCYWPTQMENGTFVRHKIHLRVTK